MAALTARTEHIRGDECYVIHANGAEFLSTLHRVVQKEYNSIQKESGLYIFSVPDFCGYCCGAPDMDL